LKDPKLKVTKQLAPQAKPALFVHPIAQMTTKT